MKWIIAICAVVLLTGCENGVTNIKVDDYQGGPIKIDEGVYVKKLYIQGVTALVYCDENGRVIPNTPINSKYNEGKYTKSSIVLQ